jgi:hypothetical protein
MIDGVEQGQMSDQQVVDREFVELFHEMLQLAPEEARGFVEELVNEGLLTPEGGQALIAEYERAQAANGGTGQPAPAPGAAIPVPQGQPVQKFADGGAVYSNDDQFFRQSLADAQSNSMASEQEYMGPIEEKYNFEPFDELAEYDAMVDEDDAEDATTAYDPGMFMDVPTLDMGDNAIDAFTGGFRYGSSMIDLGRAAKKKRAKNIARTALAQDNSRNAMLKSMEMGGYGLADGGQVPDGPDPTDRADNVPAMLSENEYVIPADIVKRKGTDFFDSLIEKGREPPKEKPPAPQAGGASGIPVQQFADGGEVQNPLNTSGISNFQSGFGLNNARSNVDMGYGATPVTTYEDFTDDAGRGNWTNTGSNLNSGMHFGKVGHEYAYPERWTPDVVPGYGVPVPRPEYAPTPEINMDPRNFGRRPITNQAIADKYGYEGDFGQGGFDEWRKTNLTDAQQGEVYGMVHNQNMGNDPYLNMQLAQQYGYGGDFGSGGWGEYYQTLSPEQQGQAYGTINNQNMGNNPYLNMLLAQQYGYGGDFGGGQWGQHYQTLSPEQQASAQALIGQYI